jgi:hypothetical protein
MIVGQSVGTAATTGLVMVGGSLAVRRASLAHIIFSVIVGVLGILFLGPLTAAADWVGAQLYDPDGVLAMATFSSLFKLAGIVVFYPWLDHFARFIVRISGAGSESAVSRLDPTLVEAGGKLPSRPSGARSWRSPMVRSMLSGGGSLENPSLTTHRPTRSSRSNTFSHRSRWRRPIWAQ